MSATCEREVLNSNYTKIQNLFMFEKNKNSVFGTKLNFESSKFIYDRIKYYYFFGEFIIFKNII